MSYTSAKSAGGPKKNNGATVVNAGNVPATAPVTKTVSVKDINGTQKTYGTKVVTDTATGNGTSDPHGVIKVKSSGTFAYQSPKGAGFLIRAAGDNASKINGVASTVFSVPGGAKGSRINKLTSTRRIGEYASTSYDVLARPDGSLVPGRTKGANAGSAVSYVQAADGFTTTNVDKAANVSRSVPGELTYMFGAKSPKKDSYKAKDSREV